VLDSNILTDVDELLPTCHAISWISMTDSGIIDLNGSGLSLFWYQLFIYSPLESVEPIR
jgi:hypothetical protein